MKLAVLDGPDVVLIAMLRRRPPRLLPRRRRRASADGLPAHATALGKCILAFSPPEAVTRLGAGGWERRTPHTLVEQTALVRELADVRRSGVATEHEEYAPGTAAVASPILVPAKRPPRRSRVAGPAASLLPDRVAGAVRAAAVTLSRRLTAERGTRTPDLAAEPNRTAQARGTAQAKTQRTGWVRVRTHPLLSAAVSPPSRGWPRRPRGSRR